MSSSYKRILARADAHFAAVAAEQPQNLACSLGCTMCCHGLFGIGAADVAIIAAGLEELQPARRDALVRRAAEILERTPHPNLREVEAAEKEAFFEQTERIPCPALDGSGACSLYESRPIVCRTFGLPLREGERYLGQECELNFTAAPLEEKERVAWDLMWEDVLDPEDEYTVLEAIVLAAKLRHSR
jgi:Fe-S-cluster containining protein